MPGGLGPLELIEFDEKTMSARLVHPCDETAVAVLLGTPKLALLLRRATQSGVLNGMHPSKWGVI